jgi:hypothetical protein
MLSTFLLDLSCEKRKKGGGGDHDDHRVMDLGLSRSVVIVLITVVSSPSISIIAPVIMLALQERHYHHPTPALAHLSTRQALYTIGAEGLGYRKMIGDD